MRSEILPAVLVIAGILVAGCTDYVFSQGSLSVQSDPSGASIYLDSAFKGVTPAVIHAIPSENHTLELRHGQYPPWNKNIRVATGQTLEIIANLSENLTSSVSLECLSNKTVSGPFASVQWVYQPGEAINLSGSAVYPHKYGAQNVSIAVNSAESNWSFVPLSYDAPLHDDMTYNLSIPAEALPFGTYVITSYIPPGQNASVQIISESPADANISLLKSVVNQYHATHSYIPDFYACANMAQDVWSIVEMEGMPARIAAGNIQNPNVTVNKYNHAWVLAEYAPDEWVAIEATGGFLVPHDPAYYRGIFFANATDFKNYIDLTGDYDNETMLVENISNQYNAKVAEVNAEVVTLDDEVSTYNRDYLGHSLSPGQYEAGQNLNSQITTQKLRVTQAKDELNRLAVYLTDEERVLAGIQSRITDLVNRNRSL
jgi:hypothetical protein